MSHTDLVAAISASGDPAPINTPFTGEHLVSVSQFAGLDRRRSDTFPEPSDSDHDRAVVGGLQAVSSTAHPGPRKVQQC